MSALDDIAAGMVEAAVAPYREALSTGFCSKHQEPDPLHCDTCNKIKWLFNAAAERLTLMDKMAKLLDDADEFASSCRLYDNKALRDLAKCNCWVCQWRKMKQGK